MLAENRHFNYAKKLVNAVECPCSPQISFPFLLFVWYGLVNNVSFYGVITVSVSSLFERHDINIPCVFALCFPYFQVM
jgi:hypothetical protein